MESNCGASRKRHCLRVPPLIPTRFSAGPTKANSYHLPWQITFAKKLRRFFDVLYGAFGIKNKPYTGDEIKTILIIRCDRLGDAVVTTPLLAALKNNFPNCRLIVLASNTNKIIFKNNPNIDKIYWLEAKSWMSYGIISIPIIGPLWNFLYSLFSMMLDKHSRSTIKELRKEKIDIVFDAVGKRRTAIMSTMLGGYTIGCNLPEIKFLYDYTAPYPWVDNTSKKHIIERYFETFWGAITR